jgi:hypothetical protein
MNYFAKDLIYKQETLIFNKFYDEYDNWNKSTKF